MKRSLPFITTAIDHPSKRRKFDATTTVNGFGSVPNSTLSKDERVSQWKEIKQYMSIENSDIDEDRRRVIAEANETRRRKDVEIEREYKEAQSNQDRLAMKVERHLDMKLRKRAQEQKQTQTQQKNSDSGDTTSAAAEPNEADDEIDPLDAFMANLTKVPSPKSAATIAKKKKNTKKERLYSDESVYDEGDLLIEDEFSLATQQKLNRKEIKAVDHSLVEYDTIAKDIYKESPDISRLSKAEIKSIRDTVLGKCKIAGKHCPRPILKWTQCGLSDKLLRCLDRYSYHKPFPIQCQAIPAIMRGRDVIGSAKTGSGKTLAFVIPMIRHILAQRPLEAGEGPIAIIMAPTRELAHQIYGETKKLCKSEGLRSCSVYGGAPVAEQISSLRRGCEIMIGTPGRIIDMLTTNSGRLVSLKRVSYLVLDEADRMFDLGFEPQITAVIRNIRPDRQTLLFSATFPKVIEKLARKILTNPIHIIIGTMSTACEDVTQFVEIVSDENARFTMLLRLLGQWYGKGNILIFHDRRDSVDFLYQKLADAGYFSLVLHGGGDQIDRDYTLLDFKQKKRSILIATSVAARGLDVKDLRVVINYSPPHHYEDYVHRVGRTGRAGSRGVAYTFISSGSDANEARYAPDILRAMLKSQQVNNVTEQLREMVKEFQDLVAIGEEKVFRHRGFKSGHGHRFDETEAQKTKEDRMRQRMIYCDTDELIDMNVISAANETDTTTTTSANATSTAAAQSKEKKPMVRGLKNLMEKAKTLKKLKAKNVDAAKIKNAMDKIEKRGKERTEKAQKKKVEQIAALISAKLNQSGSTKMGDDDDVITKHSLSVMINDAPEPARNRIVKYRTLHHIRENYDVKITSMGTYIPIGRKPRVGEEKLHLFVEGTNERDVINATKEIRRVLQDEVQRCLGQMKDAYGKFSVV